MKRKWIKWVSWILLTPILLFVVLMVLLYVPPVQNFLRKQATSYASEATGMQINVGRIDLRFPLNLLVRDVEVIQVPDTLLTLGSLNVHVQAMPLFKGKIEVDDITLQQVTVNSADFIEGMKIRGVLGRFFLESHGVDLTDETAVINHVELSDTHIGLVLNDTATTEKTDTASVPINWKVDLHALSLKNVSFSMQLPADTMRMAARVSEASIKDVSADLKHQFYGLRSFLLTGTSVNYDTGNTQPVEGFDPSHIALRDVRIGIDSVLYRGRNRNAVIREFSMNERSGLSVTSLTGRVFADSTVIRIPDFRLLTPHSEMNLTAQTYWELVNIPTTGRLTARFNALIGKQDVMLFAGGLPEAFKEAYPFRPLVVQAGTEGNLKSMQISRFKVNLPGAFSLEGGGELYNLTDSTTRSAALDLKMQTGNLNFLTALGGMTPGAPLVIPDSMLLDARLGMEGSKYDARLLLKEGEGRLGLTAALNSTTEAYTADLHIEDLQINHFLPKDSIYEFSASLAAHGRGFDFTSYKTAAALKATIDKLHYGDYKISGIGLTGTVKNAVANAQLTSDNPLLKMTADAEYHLAHHYPDGKVGLNVTGIDTEKLFGVSLGKNSGKPLDLQLTGEVRKERVFTHLTAGDLKLNLSARAGLELLIRQSTHFADVLTKQLEAKELNHAELRKALPTAVFSFSAGQDNPMAWYLATQNISYHDASAKLGCAPDWGINGKVALHTLKIDTLQLDTIFFTLKQDTSRINLRGGVINGPKNPQISFTSILTGEIRDKGAELVAQYINDKGKTGLLFGVNAKPLYGGLGKGNGLALTLVPEEPVIAFHKFRFEEHHNWIYLHKNMRVYANVDMQDNEGMGIRMQSLPSDTVSLQNMDVELRRIRLEEVFSILPYMPQITGLLSAEAHYIQTEKSLELSAEASIDELTYERQRIGDVALGATWLPGEKGKQYVNTYLTHEGTEIMVADGALYPAVSGKDSIVVNSTLEHFPLSIANVFVPDQMVTLSGDMDGDLHITGYTDSPLINGGLSLDSVSVYARQADARFIFDNRPIQVQNNRIVFDKFAIYTTSQNPFSIDGYVDFRDMGRPMANLKLFAENYTLLNAKRTKESMVYGKVFVDLDATVRGPLDGLMMRGNVNLLGNTDVTYVLTDSPLTVQDRLSDLVTFTSFADTTSLNKEEESTLSLGGLDMIMTIHIDPAVRLKADLSADRSSRVELEGGGDLSLQYTPQGDLTLTGRYTLSGGMMKYALPVIPLKEFQIQNGSYVDWTGNPMDPMLNFKATERVRASVTQEDGTSRMVNFDISIVVKNRLDNLSLAFEIDAPDDASVQNQLAGMGPDERSKQAVAMLATGIYLADSGGGSGMNLNMGAALNSVLASQINALTGNMKNASLSFGVEDHDDSDAGGKRTDYSFRYSQRFFNDRFQIVLGGKVSTGANATNDVESFIDNISLEYRLDQSGTRYIRLFHNKNYESVFEGEITETGVGLVLRKKMDRLSELFIFKKKKK
ncbi:translocation/assembly module TamB domain-containing protein [Bacteroides salyersiae]|uniref:translocation/assembly module TamB domain-containing protein n=1 Tax=Bacteroides salyersiae TaxID=291644 RepID=UPI00189AAB9F|nr:translocation/assembly module TamB domain-containing protein [Bacteroides salyersiae]